MEAVKETALQVSLGKAQPAGLAKAGVPEYLRQYAGNQAGLEEVSQEDVLVPRLSISQSNSPEVTKGDPKFIKGLETGHFFNSLTGEDYGVKVTLIPLFFFKQYIHFRDRKEGGGIEAVYQSAADVPKGGLDFVNGEKPPVTEFKCEMCLIVKDGVYDPIVASFKSTGMKTAKKWNALMRQVQLPAYARAYILDITNEKNTDGSWFGTAVTPSDFVPESFFTKAEQYFDNLRQAGVKIDTAGMGEEGVVEGEHTAF